MKYHVVGYFEEEVGPDTETCPEDIDAESKEEAVRMWGSRLTDGGDPKRYDYIQATLHTSEWEHPLSLLDDPAEFHKWQEETGVAEANQAIMDAARRHMEKHGTRSILEVEEKMAAMAARLEEFVD